MLGTRPQTILICSHILAMEWLQCDPNIQLVFSYQQPDWSTVADWLMTLVSNTHFYPQDCIGLVRFRGRALVALCVLQNYLIVKVTKTFKVLWIRRKSKKLKFVWIYTVRFPWYWVSLNLADAFGVFMFHLCQKTGFPVFPFHVWSNWNRTNTTYTWGQFSMCEKDIAFATVKDDLTHA